MGAVTGTLRHPEVLVVGRYRGKNLEVIGRTVKLKDDQAAELGKLLKPAGPGIPGRTRSAPTGARAARRPSSRFSRASWSKSQPTRPCRVAIIAAGIQRPSPSPSRRES